MWNELFVGLLAVLFFVYLYWGFRVLPGERWQILATLPHRPSGHGDWQGLNLTWYGLLSSVAQIVSLATVFLLYGAVGMTRLETVLFILIIMPICVPGSRWVARLVEGKSATFSVSGAAFIGILVLPWAVLAYNALAAEQGTATIPLLPVLAGAAIAYAFGEGLGRLACISFGCCYGKPLHQSPPMLQRLFQRWHFVFVGETKKIAYAGNLAGEKVVPIQAITALFYTGAGLAGMLIFLHGQYLGALFLALGVTQIWRVLSETLRADWRGTGHFSAYQWMSLISLPYVFSITVLFNSDEQPVASLVQGLEALWHPGLLLFLIGLWMTIFFYYGRSLVTGSRLSFYICHDRI